MEFHLLLKGETRGLLSAENFGFREGALHMAMVEFRVVPGDCVRIGARLDVHLPDVWNPFARIPLPPVRPAICR